MRVQEIQSHGVPVRPHRPVAHRKKPDRMTHRTGGSRFPGFSRHCISAGKPDTPAER